MLVLIGLISGILSGITGIQYGILIPALLFTGIIPDIKTAVGTLLYAFIPPVTALSAYSFYKQGHVDTAKGNILMVTVSLGMLLGSKISMYVSEKTIHLISAFLTLSISLFFFSISLKN
jgi:uncharacterized membrane protein YfcA